MIFEYDKEFEILKFISSSGMVQAVQDGTNGVVALHLSVADLEKLYFMLWVEISEADKHLMATLQDSLEAEHEI